MRAHINTQLNRSAILNKTTCYTTDYDILKPIL